MSTLAHFFELVVENSLRSTLLIGLLLLVRPILRGRVPAALIFAAWVVVGLRLLVPIAVPSTWSPFNGAKFWADSQMRTSAGPALGDVGLIPSSRAPSETKPITAAFKVEPEGRNWNPEFLFGIFWATGVIGLAAVRVSSSVGFWRRVRVGARQADPRLAALVQSVAAQLDIKSKVHIVESIAVAAPAVSGWWRPTLLFTPGFCSVFSDAELRWVVLHELSHWKRRDGWSHALLEWARLVHWFNPAVWLCTKAARLDCELACDEFVIRQATQAEPADYGAALLRVMGVVRGQNRSALVVGIFESKQQLKKRIHMIADYRAPTFGRILTGAVFLVSLGLVCVSKEINAQPSENSPSSPSPSSAKGASSSTATAVTQTVPPGWYVNGSHPKSYMVGLDASEIHTGAVSSYIMSTEPNIPGFGGMMQDFDAKAYKGKRVRFSAWIKTANVSQSANIWMRVDDANRQAIKFDNIQNHAPKGTQDWQHFQTVLDVPEESTGIYLGFFVKGTGQAWFNDAKFDVVDGTIPETNMPIPRPNLKGTPTSPQNLSFEAGLPQ